MSFSIVAIVLGLAIFAETLDIVRRHARREAAAAAVEPTLEIDGLDPRNVEIWYGYARDAYVGHVAHSARSFEYALDHLVRHRGPIGQDGFPIEGDYVVRDGGFAATPAHIALVILRDLKWK